jgi:hypothetical protein
MITGILLTKIGYKYPRYNFKIIGEILKKQFYMWLSQQKMEENSKSKIKNNYKID